MFLEFIRAIVVKRLLFFYVYSLLFKNKSPYLQCSLQRNSKCRTTGLHHLQAFFMSAYFVVSKYWYPCTPVYRLNGRTAFRVECDEQRDRHGYLFYLYVKLQLYFQCSYARLQRNVNPRNGYSLIQQQCIKSL